MWFVRIVVLLPIAVTLTLGQDLNIIPDILKPLLVRREQYESFNFLANLSEKAFHFGKIGIDLGTNKCIRLT